MSFGQMSPNQMYLRKMPFGQMSVVKMPGTFFQRFQDCRTFRHNDLPDDHRRPGPNVIQLFTVVIYEFS
jgi:hypothetical protein